MTLERTSEEIFMSIFNKKKTRFCRDRKSNGKTCLSQRNKMKRAACELLVVMGVAVIVIIDNGNPAMCLKFY